MSYDRWKTSMLTTLGLCLALGALVWVLWGTVYADISFTLLVGMIITLAILSFQRPQLIWGVAALGTITRKNETPKNLYRTYGPFNSKSAAVTFRNEWNGIYEGFAVVEYREKIAEPSN